MDSIDYFIEVNRQNHAAYSAGLATIDGVSLLPFDDREKNNYQYAVLVIEENLAELTRDELVIVLRAEGVLARRYFSPGNHRMQPYASSSVDSDRRLPVTLDLADTVLCLPNGTSVSIQDASRISDIIRAATTNAAGVRRILTRRKDS
ncbi:MAG: DegT/DnrJ/EryC1/StrS family aminotransferase, partial [Rhodothermia bacterium]|nr:DegT/DnrJ/EryC1/StrS family aminotransferase [Rhodothermia bacterium]